MRRIGQGDVVVEVGLVVRGERLAARRFGQQRAAMTVARCTEQAARHLIGHLQRDRARGGRDRQVTVGIDKQVAVSRRRHADEIDAVGRLESIDRRGALTPAASVKPPVSPAASLNDSATPGLSCSKGASACNRTLSVSATLSERPALPGKASSSGTSVSNSAPVEIVVFSCSGRSKGAPCPSGVSTKVSPGATSPEECSVPVVPGTCSVSLLASVRSVGDETDRPGSEIAPKSSAKSIVLDGRLVPSIRKVAPKVESNSIVPETSSPDCSSTVLFDVMFSPPETVAPDCTTSVPDVSRLTAPATEAPDASTTVPRLVVAPRSACA